MAANIFLSRAKEQSVHCVENYRSVADPYHFYTDPDPECEKICYGSGSRTNFDTDSDLDPGKFVTDPDPGKRMKYKENLKNVIKNVHIPCFMCVPVFYLTITVLYIPVII